MSKDTKIIFSPKNPQGKVVNLTKAEKTQRDLDGEQAILHRQKLDERENKKASGRQKLKDLGLDDDEIQALGV